MTPNPLNLSNAWLDLVLQSTDGRLRLEQLAAGGAAWLHAQAASGLFAVVANGRRWDASNLTLEDVHEESAPAGSRHVCLSLRGPGMVVDQHIQVYDAAAVIELWQEVRCEGTEPLHIERLDTLALNLPEQPADLFYYTGNWGSEYEPYRHPLTQAVSLESRSGRSSKGNHPWFALYDSQQRVLSASVAWSGNWVFRFEPMPGAGFRLTGGLHDWQFSKALAPGTTMLSAPVTLALGNTLNQVSQAYARIGRRYWYARNSFSDSLPVEWNHWWPYEDAEINETVFAQNVVVAQQLGFDVCTLDAGWFGPAEAGTFWEHYRGDWHKVNAERFPGGLRAVSDHVHAHGMRFGIWCEIEGLGAKAQVAIDHPDYVALRDGERVGSVCFGNPAVQDWAYATLSRLITEYAADWIKVDYNLDAGAGCNRTDHGHQAGDGHYEHIHGYYRTLAQLRAEFPEVVFESCSSGGLRIDLGLLRQTHMTYLSDPDWPEHDLQIFWGASTMLAPDTLLHWTYSEWRHRDPPPYQKFDPHAPDLTPAKWEYYARISMLGRFGLSQKLPRLPAWLAARIAEQIALYQRHVRRFVRDADLYRLTDQPLRSGTGERWAAFQYSQPDQSEHLLFVFRLPGAEPQRAIRLQGLASDRIYTIAGLEGETPQQQRSGRELMEDGLVFADLAEQDSALLKLS